MKEVDILTVACDIVPHDVLMQEFCPIGGEQLDAILGVACYRWRPDMEQDQRFKQIIPYVVVRVAGEIITYRRGLAGNEARLHNMYSLGVGGHVDRPDTFWDAVVREVEEEIGVICNRDQFHVIGTINDNSTDVGRVHLGIVMILDLPYVDFSHGEHDILEDKKLLAIEDIRKRLDQYEKWSRIVAEQPSLLI